MLLTRRLPLSCRRDPKGPPFLPGKISVQHAGERRDVDPWGLRAVCDGILALPVDAVRGVGDKVGAADAVKLRFATKEPGQQLRRREGPYDSIFRF